MDNELSSPPELNEAHAWYIRYSENKDGPVRIIVNTTYGKPIENDAYNYEVYIPVVMAPINKSTVLVLSEFSDRSNILGLRIHDLRLTGSDMTSSIAFTLRGNQYQLKRFKHDMMRAADEARCVGISFFLRKLFYTGFNTIMCPKVLRSKPNSTLQAALMMTKSAIDNKGADDV